MKFRIDHKIYKLFTNLGEKQPTKKLSHESRQRQVEPHDGFKLYACTDRGYVHRHAKLAFDRSWVRGVEAHEANRIGLNRLTVVETGAVKSTCA